MSRFLHLIAIAGFSFSAFAEVEMPTTSYNEVTKKQQARTSTKRSEHQLSVLPLASDSEKNHALFFGTTLQTPSEAGSGMILQSYCSASHVNVGNKTLILSSYHCLSESSYFYPYFLGFEGVWMFSHFDYALAAVQMKFDVTDVNYDVALFYETNRAMKESQYFNPLNLADRLPNLYEAVTVIGYPGGVGPAKITCTYYGMKISSTASYPLAVLSGKIYCPSIAHLDVGGASGSAVLNREGKVVGVFKSGAEPHMEFAPMLSSTLKVTDGKASFDFSKLQGRQRFPQINDQGDRFDCNAYVNDEGLVHGKASCKHLKSGDTERAEYRNGVLIRPWSY